MTQLDFIYRFDKKDLFNIKDLTSFIGWSKTIHNYSNDKTKYNAVSIAEILNRYFILEWYDAPLWENSRYGEPIEVFKREKTIECKEISFLDKRNNEVFKYIE